MTTTTATFPGHGRDDQDRKRLEAFVRQMTHMLNQGERHHRWNMTSQEGLSDQIDAVSDRIDQRQQRSDQGIGEVLKMLMISEDARKEGHDKVIGLLGSILKELRAKDFVVVPEKERLYTFDPDEEDEEI